MFVYSFRASTIKFLGVICVALCALITIIAFVPTYTVDATVGASAESDEVSYSYDKVKDAEDVKNFLKQFGFDCAKDALEVCEITLPSQFDGVLCDYNEIQKRQGLDLSRYKGKKLTRYTMEITNYPNYKGTVYANVITYKNKVVAGDICSADVNGFIKTFENR